MSVKSHSDQGALVRLREGLYKWEAPKKETFKTVSNLFNSLEKLLNEDSPDRFFLAVDITHTALPDRLILRRIQESFVRLSRRPEHIVFITGKNRVINMAAQFAVRPVVGEAFTFFLDEESAYDYVDELSRKPVGRGDTTPSILSPTFRYTAIGIFFGFLFPFVATLILSFEQNLSFWDVQMQTGWLIWIIDTAPLFLGGFAYLIGIRQDEIQKTALYRSKEDSSLLSEINRLKIRRVSAGNLSVVGAIFFILGGISLLAYKWIESKEEQTLKALSQSKLLFVQNLITEKLSFQMLKGEYLDDSLLSRFIGEDYFVKVWVNGKEVYRKNQRDVNYSKFETNTSVELTNATVSFLVAPTSQLIKRHMNNKKSGYFFLVFLTLSGFISMTLTALYVLKRHSGQSEKEKDLILAQLKEGVFRLDLLGNITFVNNAVEVMLGYSANELKGSSMDRIVRHRKNSDYDQNDGKTVSLFEKGVSHYVTDEVFWRKDGSSIAVDYIVSSIIEDGQVTGTLVTFSDVTESREYLQALRNSEATLKEAQKIANIGSWHFNVSTQKISWTDQMYEIFPENKEDGEPSIESHYNSIHVDDREYWTGTVQKCLRDGLPYMMEFRTRHSDGRVVWVRAYGEGTKNELGSIVVLHGTCQDITSEKQKQRNLELLAYSSELGLWERNLRTNYVKFDKRWCEIIGYSPGELDPRLEVWKKLVHPEDVDHMMEAFDNYLSGASRLYEVKYRLRHRDGHYVPILSKGKIIEKDADGNALVISGTHFDLTYFQKMEDELEKQRQIAQHQAKLASIGELAAGVGHEINNPLAIANGNVDKIEKELAKEVPSSGVISTAFKKYKTASWRIANIVQGLRTFARSDTEHFVKFEVTNIVKQTIGLVEDIYAKEGVKIKYLIPKYPIYIEGSVGRFQQALMNLFANAKDATEDKTDRLLEVVLSEENNKVCLKVRDNGKGIPDSLKEKVFDNFFTTKDIGKGTGMGLSLTSTIIKEHNGSLALDSQEGVGTIFTIEIPKADEEEVIVNESQTCEKRESSYVPKRVLLVDDENLVREVLRDLLTEIGVEDFVEANDGIEALEIIKNSEPFDVIFTDLKMPRMDGLTLLKELRDNPPLPMPILVAVTGGIATNFTKEGRGELSSLIDGYILKPFSEEQIVEALEKAVMKTIIEERSVA